MGDHVTALHRDQVSENHDTMRGKADLTLVLPPSKIHGRSNHNLIDKSNAYLSNLHLPIASCQTAQARNAKASDFSEAFRCQVACRA